MGQAAELINPMKADQCCMRRTIVPGLLRSVAYNQSRGVKNVQLYEMGTVFSAHEGAQKPKERRKLKGKPVMSRVSKLSIKNNINSLILSALDVYKRQIY